MIVFFNVTVEAKLRPGAGTLLSLTNQADLIIVGISNAPHPLGEKINLIEIEIKELIKGTTSNNKVTLVTFTKLAHEPKYKEGEQVIVFLNEIKEDYVMYPGNERIPLPKGKYYETNTGYAGKVELKTNDDLEVKDKIKKYLEIIEVNSPVERYLEMKRILTKDANSKNMRISRDSLSELNKISSLEKQSDEYLIELVKKGKGRFEDQRGMAIGILGYRKSKNSIDLLIKLLEKEDLRSDAMLTLGYIGNKKALTPLTEVILNEKLDNKIKAKAIRALVKFPNKRGISKLEKLLKNERLKEEIKIQINKAIKKLGKTTK